VHTALLPLASWAVQVTVFVPLGNTLPDGGTHVTGSAAQLSVAVAVKLATVSHRPVAVFNVRSVGHKITGRSVSFTLTEKMHSRTLPDVSTATQ
jgi:hypothetical protein